jgi:CDP-glycerol glycerophosphotransferase (TagB/SpsB family)
MTPYREETVVCTNIAYFIEDSPHYLPVVLPLISETGGMLLYLRRKTVRNLDHPDMDMQLRCFRGYKQLVKALPDLHVDIMVHPSFTMHYFRSVPGIRHVQVFHGTSDKPFNFHRSVRLYDLIAVPGLRMKQELLRRHLAEENQIAIVGYPKIDSFVHSDFDADAFKNEIGIDPSRKTVLYSPTWDDPNRYSSFSTFVIPLLKQSRKVNLIIKPHPNILKFRPWQIWLAYLLKRKNCYIFAGSINILPFMAVADVLLTDISSVSHEFLPFKKPMIFLSPKPPEKIPDEHKWIWKCGDVVVNRNDLWNVINENLINTEKYTNERLKASGEIFLEFDGRSSLRFHEALERLMNK